VLNEYVQWEIGYIRFGPFVAMKKEEWNCQRLYSETGQHGLITTTFVLY